MALSELDGGSRASRAFALTRLHLDLPLLAALLLLCATGLVVLFSATDQSSGQLERQALRLAIAFGVMLVIAQMPPHQLQRWSPPLFILGVLLLVAVLVIG